MFGTLARMHKYAHVKAHSTASRAKPAVEPRTQQGCVSQCPAAVQNGYSGGLHQTGVPDPETRRLHTDPGALREIDDPRKVTAGETVHGLMLYHTWLGYHRLNLLQIIPMLTT